MANAIMFNGRLLSLEPIGYSKSGKPWYPVAGGAPEPGEGQEDPEEDPDNEGADDDPEDGAADAEPVTFASKADFIKHVNGIVKGRVARVEKKYAPVVAERDTLKTKVAELSGDGKDKTDASQQVQALSAQVTELLAFQKAAQRNELVRSIAKDHGLPDELHARVQGDDEDSITEDVEQLVELFKIDGKPAKKTPAKDTKPADKGGKGGKGSDGKGGQDDDAANDLNQIASEVGRYGHRPVFVGK